jgi:glycosyltransferase involved in cell wall biosynthesis
MKILGIVALVNFNDWDKPDYTQTGGINSVIKSILPYLKADKIFLYGFTHNPKELYQEKIIDNRIICKPFFVVPIDSRIPIRLYGIIAGYRLRKLVSKDNINIIYSHAEELAIWLPLKRITSIHHIHTLVNVLDISAKRSAKVPIFRMIWNSLRNQVIKRSSFIVSINPEISKLIESITDKNKIIEFPNYTDYSIFHYYETQRVNIRKHESEKIVLHIGRLVSIKGLELFIDIVRELNINSQEIWRGVLVGNGEAEKSLKNYVDYTSMDNHITFIGSINDLTTIAEFYSTANVKVITSHSESVPLTLIESLACGTPVVSTPVGIARETINDSNGKIVESRNPREFAHAIRHCQYLKSRKNILPNPDFFSIERAANLLNHVSNR